MDACLAPNGVTRYDGQTPCTRLHVGTADGVVTLERSGPGAAWQVARRSLAGCHISSLMLEPRRGGLFAGVHHGGLYLSLDGGQTWEPRSRGIAQEHVFTLASVERDGAVVLYLGTEPAHLYQSVDYGESWEELPALRSVDEIDRWMFPAPPHEPHVKDIAFDPRDSRTMYVAIEQGALLKTTDAGQTFRELKEYSRPDDPVYRDLHRVILRPSNPDEIYFSGGAGLYYSKNGGETWEHLSGREARVGYPDGLVLSPENDQVLYMAGASENPGTWRQSHDANAAIVRSRDGGRTWEHLDRGLPAHLRGNVEALSLAAWPGGFSLFAGTTDGDVFASDDKGESWTVAASGLAPVSKGGHYRPLVTAAGSGR